MQDSDWGGGVVEIDAPKAQAHEVKGTTTVTLDFDNSDDDANDEDAEKSRASCLTESTIDVNSGEKVACQLEKGVSMSKFFLFLYCLI